MQLASPEGLGPAPPAERRREVVPYLNATPGMGKELVEMWSDKSVDAARTLLSRNDVTVTNPHLDDLNTLTRASRRI